MNKYYGEDYRSIISAAFDGLTLPQGSKEAYLSRQNLDADIPAEDLERKLIFDALDKLQEIKPEGGVTGESLKSVGWNFFAARILLSRIYKTAEANTLVPSYTDYFSVVKDLVKKGVYSSILLEKYTEAEIRAASELIQPDRDLLFDYAGIKLLSERYLVKNSVNSLLELPQERFLTCALWIMQDEPLEIRHQRIEKLYWATSNLLLSLATPTLANAGKPYNSMASCHQISIPDNLTGIYDALSNAAEFSKNGAGLGIGFSRLRGTGSSIKGFKNRANSFIYWLKLFDTTATAVDQQGTRNGSIAAWLSVWHSDILAFLDLRLNTGDQSMRSHNLSLGITIPDVFWRQVEARGEWSVFDPYDVKATLGFDLNDCFDNKKLAPDETPNLVDHEFTVKYNLCVASNLLSKKTYPVLDIVKAIIKLQLEVGYPSTWAA